MARQPYKLYWPVKRALDVSVSLIALVILAIPIAIICLVVRMDGQGKALMTQERVGRNGKPFRLLKIRTMVADAWNLDKYLDAEQRAQWERERKVDDDPRVTKVGAVLRKTSLDELPQFLNVLTGSMSIVGPRPICEDELRWYGDKVGLLLSLRPGITGYWQVEARNDADYLSGERQALELYYVEHLSARLDASIFFRTFTAIFRKTGR